MKNLIMFLFIFALVLGSSLQTHAELIVRGTDSLGNQLIYDSDLDITWYDYSNPDIGINAQSYQFNWASNLEVNFAGSIYDDWRLPINVDGPLIYGYDGTTTGGYNMTTGEMGHLFYSELENIGEIDTSGNDTDCENGTSSCLSNTGPFIDLKSDFYWSNLAYLGSSEYYWVFDTYRGSYYIEDTYVWGGYGIAVRSGDVTVVPEPISSTLFLIGGGLLAGRRYLGRKK